MTGMPLQFASAKFLMRLTRGGHCPMPHHEDKRPSFSAKPGREPGTTIVACGVCSGTKEGHLALLAHLRKLGYRLGPMKMAVKRQRRPVIATTSIAWRALTPSERRMYDQIHASDDGLTYNDFVLAGISRSAVSVGLRALQALGFLGVKRSPRRKGCQRYGQNRYWIERRWLDYEADGLSQAIKAKALDAARIVARAARNGGEDISQPAPLDASRHRRKTETGGSDLRVSEVWVRGSDSGTESYVVRSLASKSEHSDRLTLSMKRTSGGSGSDAAPPLDPMSVTGAIRRERVLKPTPSRWTLAMIDRLGDDASGHSGADTAVAPSSQSRRPDRSGGQPAATPAPPSLRMPESTLRQQRIENEEKRRRRAGTTSDSERNRNGRGD